MLGIKRNIEIITPTDNENKIIGRINPEYMKYSQMTKHESEFINAIILRNNPKKLLEIGVSAGCSTLIILNAIDNKKDTKLYSIDNSEDWYKQKDKKTGFLVDEYKELKSKWKLYTNGLAINFIEEIGRDIDFCLIDTMHKIPGGILDFLMIFPFLKDDAIVIIHDTKLNTCDYEKRQPGFSRLDMANNLLMNCLFGKKIIQGNFTKEDDNNGIKTILPNIEGIKINRNTRDNIFGIINLLSLKWEYLPQAEEMNSILMFFEKYYDGYLMENIKELFEYQIMWFGK